MANEFYEKEHNLYTYINDAKAYVEALTNRNYEHLNDELKENISHVQKELERKYRDIKVHTNDEISRMYNVCTTNTTELLKDMKNVVCKTERRYEELQYFINEIRNDVVEKINIKEVYEIKNSYEEELSNLRNAFDMKIEEIQKSYATQIEEQKINYEYKIIALEEKIDELNKELTENKKGFFVKLFERNKKR